MNHRIRVRVFESILYSQEVPLPIDLVHNATSTPNCNMKSLRSWRHSPKQWHCNGHGQLLVHPAFACLFCCHYLDFEQRLFTKVTSGNSMKNKVT